MNSPTHAMRLSAASIGIVLALAAGCSSGASRGDASPMTTVAAGASATPDDGTRDSAEPRGRRVEGLDFAVPNTVAGRDAAERSSTPPAVGVSNATSGTRSDRDAVTTFLDRAIAADFAGAWALLSESDRTRLAGPSALAEQFAAGEWTSYTIEGAGTGAEAVVTVEVVQTPRINEIVGLVSPTATVDLPTTVENGSHFVRWTRRTVEQHYPLRSDAADAAVRDAVIAWAKSRAACGAATNEYANGLLGVVGLADALCRTSGTGAMPEVGDLDALDEPEPIIEGFGGSALSWARVVTLDGPVPMRVVAAPVGDGWTVIGLARTSLTGS